MKKLLLKTKRGGASMFVVMFTMIILSIITLGFTRLIISEATKTTNTDLSQSAYDSALAGVEDAKMALLKYHACLDSGYRAQNTSGCSKIIYDMQQGIKNRDCSTVQKVLGRDQEADNNAVVVQETQSSNQDGNNANMLQSYTCVTIQEDLDDYRTTLDSSSRLRVIPIRSANHKVIDRIQIKWFSSVNAGRVGNQYKACGDQFYSDKFMKYYPLGSCSGGVQTPPIIAARLIQTDETFDISQLTTSKKYASGIGTDTGQIYLVPSALTTGNPVGTVAASVWGETANKGENHQEQVVCKKYGAWSCTVDLKLPDTFNGKSGDNKNDANSYLLVSLPYGMPDTDISITTWNGTTQYEFTGIQARIDSTGRANDLYRRVETRVELVDTYFAYPEFEITMLGGSESSLKKTFDVTFNCWASEEGEKHDCAGGNSRARDSYSNF